MTQGKTLVTEGKTLQTKGKTLVMEGKTLVTNEKTERIIDQVKLGRSPQLPAVVNSSDNIGENSIDHKDSLLSQLDSLREEIKRSASDKFSDVQINLQNYLSLLSENV